MITLAERLLRQLNATRDESGVLLDVINQRTASSKGPGLN